MKSKRAIIVYVKGFINNLATVERMFLTVVNMFTSEGRKLKYVTNDTAMFDDGSRIDKVPFGRDFFGTRVTHLFVDEEILKLRDGKSFVDEALLPMVVEGNYVSLDTEGSKAKDRVIVFNNEGVTKYNEK